LDYGVTSDSVPFIAIELVEGQSLRQHLESEGVFEPRRAVLVVREICRALAAAHSEFIIHRDLKPTNIIVDNHNIAKVIDFGIAKAVGASGDTITAYGAVIGTPAYMSPEQCLGERVDARSDIYSLGCTFFEMLTNIKAFDSATAVEAIAKQISPDRSHIARRLKSTNAPEPLQKIILKCLDRKPDNRYRNISELDHDLSAFLIGLPPKFAGTSQAILQMVLASAIAGLSVFLITYLVANSHSSVRMPDLGPRRAPHIRPVYTSMPPVPVGPMEVRDRTTGAIIFSDPTAANMTEVLMDANKRGLSLVNADLRRAQLSRLSLNSMNLANADLSNALMMDAQLTDVNLHGAILSHTCLLHASLLGVNLSNADLDHALLSSVNAPSCNFVNADLSEAQLMLAKLERANCTGADFSNARMHNANMQNTACSNAQFVNAKLMVTDFRGANCSDAKFDGAIMNNTDFKGATLTHASFRGTHPMHVWISGANLNGAELGGITTNAQGYLEGNY
jgi:serine/threonine protein kinase